MPNKTNLKPNHTEVAAQILDDEVIIIRLTDGIYYSLAGVGVFVWRLIEANNSVDDIMRAAVERYEVDADQVTRDVNHLIESLLKERLVINCDRNPKKTTQNDLTVNCNQDGSQYTAPTLNVYEDMNELLALDPPSPGQQEFNSPDTRE